MRILENPEGLRVGDETRSPFLKRKPRPTQPPAGVLGPSEEGRSGLIASCGGPSCVWPSSSPSSSRPSCELPYGYTPLIGLLDAHGLCAIATRRGSPCCR